MHEHRMRVIWRGRDHYRRARGRLKDALADERSCWFSDPVLWEMEPVFGPGGWRLKRC